MKHLKKFNESVNHNKVNDFITRSNSIINYNESEYEQGDEPASVDILSELGELYDDIDMTIEDLDMVINSGRVSDVDGFLKIIADDVRSDSDTSNIVSKPGNTLEKVEVYYACMNNGDGSVSLEWYLTDEEAEAAEDNQDEGWGEHCNGSVETFVGSDIHRKAKRNSK